MLKRRVFPVVHHKNEDLTMEQSILAISAGADGVFLISHGGADDELLSPARRLKEMYQGVLIGLNFLGSHADVAFDKAVSVGADMLWTDYAGVSSAGVDDLGRRLSVKVVSMGRVPVIFGSVAFKYQKFEGDPPKAAVNAAALGLIPTTSGSGTGSAPEVSKLSAMRKALPDTVRLAVASGMDCSNVEDFLPYVTDFLVATGISTDMHHFDPSLLVEFVRKVHK